MPMDFEGLAMTPPPRLEMLYDLAGFSPNPNQAQAIGHTSNPLFLVAGPGSGKTRVLLWRTLNLIVHHGIKPEEIFLATFTEKAAQQLKDGLLSLLGMVSNLPGQPPYDLSKMYVGTVHSLCNRILTDRVFAPNRVRRETPVVMDALEQYFRVSHRHFWNEARVALDLPTDLSGFYGKLNLFLESARGASSSRHRAVTGLLSVFNRLSEENLEPAELMSLAQDDEMRSILSLYTQYKDGLGRSTDLSLLQQAAYRTVSALPSSARVFKHVIVDEYQDTNAIQEQLYFALARGHSNLCVVGDDEQALYRFRGATVENFVQFPERCLQNLGCPPTRIELNTNYRSRAEVVDFYTRFMGSVSWQRPQGGHYRIEGKDITAHSGDTNTAVVVSSGAADDVAADIASAVATLIRNGKVSDANQIAFLFPYLRGSVHVERMQAALEQHGLKVYAPRAGRFLDAEEPTAMIGLMLEVLGMPERDPDFNQGDLLLYNNWLDAARDAAREIVRDDPRLKDFIAARRVEIAGAIQDYESLMTLIRGNGWDEKAEYDPDKHKRALTSAHGLSDRARRGLGTTHLDKIAKERLAAGQGFTLRYIVNRATALDWNVLDLFYRLCGFDHFKAMFDVAEKGEDEGPICNLSLVSKLLSRFLDQTQTVLTAANLSDDRLKRQFFGSYLFALYRMAEGEYEDVEDPFPKGRIPFLTIHQSKGLEFPVVVLGSVSKTAGKPQRTETLIRPFLKGEPEPLERISEFDVMRQYYVALSRAQNLLVIAQPIGRGQRCFEPFKALLPTLKRLSALNTASVPAMKHAINDISRTYSYTGDFLAYQHCPRNYMIFNKYGFASSRSQSMFFGSLVHRTLEDLHNHLMAARDQPSMGVSL